MVEARSERYVHSADVGVRGVGATVDAAFEQAAMALAQVVADPARVAPRETVRLSCSAPDREMLLVDWLNALIYEMATRGMLFSRFEVRIDGSDLEATAWGEPADAGRHDPGVEAKGATYTDLSVRQDEDGAWIAQCVVDV